MFNEYYDASVQPLIDELRQELREKVEKLISYEFVYERHKGFNVIEIRNGPYLKREDVLKLLE